MELNSKYEGLNLEDLKNSNYMGRKSGPGGTTRDRDSAAGSSYTFLDSADGNPNLTQNEEGGPPVKFLKEFLNSVEDDGYDEGNDDSSSAASDNSTLPHPPFELHGNATSAQLELTSQLFYNSQLPSGSIETHARNSADFEGFPRDDAKPVKRVFADGSRTRGVVCRSAEEGANETLVLGRETGGCG